LSVAALLGVSAAGVVPPRFASGPLPPPQAIDRLTTQVIRADFATTRIEVTFLKDSSK
jgi:hypothetical protein